MKNYTKGVWKYVNSNEVIISSYPWLALYDDNNNLRTEITLLDLLPEGWRGLVLEMCQEIAEVLQDCDMSKHRYQVAEAKEKWCALDWYDYMGTWDKEWCCLTVPDEIREITQEYWNKSKEVCMICGAPKSKDEQVCQKCAENRIM